MVWLFYVLASKTEKQVLQNIAREVKEYGYKESDFDVQKKKLGNLWFIVKFYLAT